MLPSPRVCGLELQDQTRAGIRGGAAGEAWGGPCPTWTGGGRGLHARWGAWGRPPPDQGHVVSLFLLSMWFSFRCCFNSSLTQLLGKNQVVWLWGTRSDLGGWGSAPPWGHGLGEGSAIAASLRPLQAVGWHQAGWGAARTEAHEGPMRPPGQRPPTPVSQDMSVHSRAPGRLRGGTQGSSAPVGGQKGEHLRERGTRSPSPRTPLTGHSGL